MSKRKCEFDECNTQPCFNFCNEHYGVRCYSHKLPEMVNVVSKTCNYDGCNTPVKIRLRLHIFYFCISKLRSILITYGM